MPGTRRVPLRRPTDQPVITPKALEIFAQLERARRARKHADCTVSKHGLCETDHCGACRQWWDAHDALDTELDMPPWRWPCIPHNPYPPGSPGAREWRPGTEQQELYDLLKEARRAATATRRKTPSSQEGSPNVIEPVDAGDTFT